MNKPPSALAEQIFLAACELDAAEREDYVASRCKGDAELLLEVTTLLRAADECGDYFEVLPHRLGIEAFRNNREPASYGASAGQRFGQYRLTAKLGSGGMGEVWRAERGDGRFEGEVAVKIFTRLGGKSALGQFDDEAQYLAKLTHANIARLIDAGLGPGDTPYLILDFVDGRPIDQYCDAHVLNIDDRIRLVIEVLEAVSHAHSCLIVHSDIKPSNVLVTTEGQVKLLDFGIARLLTAVDSDDTSSEAGVGLTPEYAAPEQLAGGGITTATDVYSMGLLLYVLLAGSSPREVAEVESLAELRDLANEEPPSLARTIETIDAAKDGELERLAGERGASPQRFLRTLRGELDHIVRKALAVAPKDRYRTAADFAADLRSYLRHEPVTAFPDSVSYRARKFVRRYRGGVLTGSLTLIVIVVAAGIAIWQGIEADRQRDAALYHQQRVHASNEFYSLLLEEMGTGDESFTAVQLLDRGVELLERQFDPDAAFIGRVHYDLSRRYSNLQENTREQELLARAENAARANGDHDLLAASLCAMGWMHRRADIEQARRLFEDGRATLSMTSLPTVESRVVCMRLNSYLTEARGDRNGAIDILNDIQDLLKRTPAAPSHLRGVSLNDLSGLLMRDARFSDALDVNAEILEHLESSGRGNTFGYLQVMSNRAVFLGAVGEVLADHTVQQQLLSRLGESNWATGRAGLQFDISRGGTLIRLSRFEEGIRLLENARDKAERNGAAGMALMADIYLAGGYIAVDDFEKAEQKLQAVEGTFESNPTRFEFQRRLVTIRRAAILRKRGRIDEARALIQPILESYNYPPLSGSSASLAALLEAMNAIEFAAGDFAAAEQLSSDLLEVRERQSRRPELSAHVGGALVRRAKARRRQNNIEGAIQDLMRAVTALENGLGTDNRETREARDLLREYRTG